MMIIDKHASILEWCKRTLQTKGIPKPCQLLPSKFVLWFRIGSLNADGTTPGSVTKNHAGPELLTN